MTTRVTVPDGTWTQVATGASAVEIQAHGDVQLHVGTVAPTAGSAGFALAAGEAYVNSTFTGLTAWARGVGGATAVTRRTAA